jgi:hypothetical protein
MEFFTCGVMSVLRKLPILEYLGFSDKIGYIRGDIATRFGIFELRMLSLKLQKNKKT